MDGRFRPSQLSQRSPSAYPRHLGRVSLWIGVRGRIMTGMIRAGVFPDELWALIEPVLPENGVRRGRPWNDHRLTLEGIAWRFRTGSPWRDVPEEFGAWQSLWKRHRLWSTDGTYEQMFAAVRKLVAGPGPGGGRSAVGGLHQCASSSACRGRPVQRPGGPRRGHRRTTRIRSASQLIMPWAGPGVGGPPKSTP